jgi:hypothetical protein
MSWGCRYVLPWQGIDLPAIESAIGHVLAGLPPRLRESRLEVRGPDAVSWFVQVYADEERRWTVLGVKQVEQVFALYEVAEGESIWVEIVFSHDPGDPAAGLPPQTAFSFDTADSGNYLAPGGALRVCELLAAYFGVECERG